MPERQSKVLIVDDHPLVRLWLGHLIEDQPDLTVCGEADNLREAWKRIETESPDIVILDVSLPDGTALELIKSIKSTYPKLPVLVLSMHDEQIYAERVVRAGARGFVMKCETADRIMDAIYDVLRGKIAVSDVVAASFAEKFGEGRPPPSGPRVERLSDRELEIFELIGAGVDTRTIASKLRISIKTVQTHCAKIKEKLELENATELLREALRWYEFQPRS